VLAPDSRASSWDFLRGGYGPDVAFIDRALDHVFDRCAIDPARIALAGFSDGASYALSLGLANGDLFTHLIAFSPGFAAPQTQVGAPRVFVSHGTGDPVLPIDRCSRRLVPVLRAGGYALEYTEFDGGHTVPRDLTRRAIEWLLDG
jgi:phospholipase/carboxylesterase